MKQYILPFRDFVVHPGLTVPVYIDNKTSIACIESAGKTGQKLVLVAQRTWNYPVGAHDIYDIGTIGDIVISQGILGKMIHNLRNDRKRGRLKDEQIKVLDEMGMVWRVEPYDWFTPFYKKLIDYKERRGNFDGITRDPEIGNLAVNVRQAYRGKGKRKITSVMIEKLNEIGFPWEVGYRHWFDPFYEKLVAYKEKKGSFKGLSTDPEIGETVGRLRQAYRGKGNSRLTKEIIEKLDAIGFIWDGNQARTQKKEDLSI